MTKRYVFLFLVALVMVAFTSYKIGDYYGFAAGQKYGLVCYEELKRQKDVIDHMKLSAKYANRPMENFSEKKSKTISFAEARRYNATRDSLLKVRPNNILRAIKSYNDDGSPNFDDDFLKCVAGLGPCNE